MIITELISKLTVRYQTLEVVTAVEAKDGQLIPTPPLLTSWYVYKNRLVNKDEIPLGEEGLARPVLLIS